MSYLIKVPERQNHDAQCWRYASHWRCAVMRVERLEQLLELVVEENISMGETLLARGLYEEIKAELGIED